MAATATVTSRAPRRRSETRKRLLEATQAILAEGGVAAVTVDSVTSRAGYTRGAFYSNFSSIDDLVFGLYAEHMSIVLHQLDGAMTRVTSATPQTVKAAVESVVAVMPFDIEWLRIRITFASQARYDSTLRAQFSEHEQEFHDALKPVILEALKRVGRAPTVTADEFTRAIVAAHNGALANTITDDDPLRLRVVVCTAVVMSLTRDVTAAVVASK